MSRTSTRQGDEDREDGLAPEADERQPTLLTVERALKLLRTIVFEQSLSIREAARVTGTSPSSAYRLLRALDEGGFIERENDTGRFRPGTEMRRMVAHLLGATDVRREAMEPMRGLAEQWRETVTLCLRTTDDQRLYFDRVASPQPLQYVMPLGDLSPLHVGSSGRALLAFMRPEEIDRALSGSLRAYTSATPTDPALIREELALTRSRGYAVSFGERLGYDMVGVSAPIFDSHGTVVASLLLSIPRSRVTQADHLDAVGHSVRAAADLVSLRMGWMPGRADT